MRALACTTRFAALRRLSWSNRCLFCGACALVSDLSEPEVLYRLRMHRAAAVEVESSGDEGVMLSRSDLSEPEALYRLRMHRAAAVEVESTGDEGVMLSRRRRRRKIAYQRL